MNFTVIHLSSSYFLSSYYMLGPVLVTWIIKVNRMGVIPGDLTLQLGEAREHTSNLIKEKKITFI